MRLRDLFKSSADKKPGMLLPQYCFSYGIGDKTIKYPQVVARDGSTADMDVVYDEASGMVKADVSISVKMADGSSRTYQSRFRAKRSEIHPNHYEIKELVFDNVALNTRDPGHIELWNSRIGMYRRIIESGYGPGTKPAIPGPFALDKGFKSDIVKHTGLLWKAQRFYKRNISDTIRTLFG